MNKCKLMDTKRKIICDPSKFITRGMISNPDMEQDKITHAKAMSRPLGVCAYDTENAVNGYAPLFDVVHQSNGFSKRVRKDGSDV